MSDLLQIRDLSVRLNEKEILQDLNLDLPIGKFIGLVGPNGAGKSTLLRSCLKLLPANASFTTHGQDILRLSTAERARYISFLPQDRELAWAMNVEAVVRLGLPNRSPIGERQPRGDDERIDEALALLELTAFRYRPANALSGGELARVLLARLLVQDTPIILADEPLAGLDPQQQIKVMRLFKSLARAGKTIVASIHDLSQAALWCDEIVLLDQGRIAAQGHPCDVFTAQNLAATYQIQADIREINGKLSVVPLDTIE